MRRVAWLLLVGCYHPSPAANVPCSTTLECPGGQTCDVTQEPPTCIAGDGPLAIDASLIDGTDAPPIDAAIDAAPVGCSAGNPCPGSTPICDQGTCRGCIRDAECPDDVCVERIGQCVAAANAIYLDPAGLPGTCTRAAPCGGLDQAFAQLTPTRRTIRLAAGTYSHTGPLAIPPTGDLTISGPGEGAPPVVTNPNNGANGDVLTLGVGASALVETISISGGRDAIAVDGGTATASRIVFGSNGQHSVRTGRTGPNSVVHIEDSILPNGGREGVHISESSVVDVRRCTIRDNTNGGILAETGSKLTVVDTLIVSNGGAASTVGGVDVTAAATIVQFSFNTVASNTIVATAGIAAGLVCSVAQPVDDSIFANNLDTNGVESNLDPLCNSTYSLFDTAPSPGTGNRAGATGFVSTNDFHITAASAARSNADPNATESEDVDGQPRPQGGARDIGADEIP